MGHQSVLKFCHRVSERAGTYLAEKGIFGGFDLWGFRMVRT